MKIWKYTFCEEFHWGHFYDDDVITVTSLVLRTQSVSAVGLFGPAVFYCNLQVLNSIV